MEEKEVKKVCPECGHSGPENNCPDCGDMMVDPESIDEEQDELNTNDNVSIQEALEEEQGVEL